MLQTIFVRWFTIVVNALIVMSVVQGGCDYWYIVPRILPWICNKILDGHGLSELCRDWYGHHCDVNIKAQIIATKRLVFIPTSFPHQPLIDPWVLPLYLNHEYVSGACFRPSCSSSRARVRGWGSDIIGERDRVANQNHRHVFFWEGKGNFQRNILICLAPLCRSKLGLGERHHERTRHK